MEILATNMDCKVDSLSTYYLGLPLGSTFKSKAVWEVVVVEIFEVNQH